MKICADPDTPHLRGAHNLPKVECATRMVELPSGKKQLKLFGIETPAETKANIRRVEITAEIDNRFVQKLAFLHTALASVCLPYREPKEPGSSWVRTNGKVRLSIDPGRKTDDLGNRVYVGVP